MRLILLPLLVVAVAGCSQAIEGRIAARLHEAGLPVPMSECMAGRWVDRLNVAQLRRIQTLAGTLKAERSAGELTVLRLIERIRDLNDPEILEVVTTSTALCALRS